MPEIARIEKEPNNRSKPSLEESGIDNAPAALGGGIVLACHILPHSIIKTVKLSWQTYCENGAGVDTPKPRTIRKGSPSSL
jgi:hypothetical protein